MQIPKLGCSLPGSARTGEGIIPEKLETRHEGSQEQGAKKSQAVLERQQLLALRGISLSLIPGLGSITPSLAS